MAKAPIWVIGGSLVAILLSIVLIGAGGVDSLDIDVQSEAIFQGKSGTVTVQEDSSYTIFVNDRYTCYNTDISIYDDQYEYFNEDCDSTFDEQGWRQIGFISADSDTTLTVNSNNEVIIVDDLIYLSEGGVAVIGGGLLCCVGIIGLVVGIVLLATNNKGQQVMYVQQPMQQMQQQTGQQMYQQQGQQMYQQTGQQMYQQQGQPIQQQTGQQMYQQTGQPIQRQTGQHAQKTYIDHNAWDSQK